MDEDAGPEEQKGMDPALMWGLIGGGVAILLLLMVMMMGGGNNDRDRDRDDYAQDDGEGNNRPRVNIPPRNNGSSSGGSGSSIASGENLVALERLANEVIRVAGVIHHSYLAVIEPEDGSGPTGNTMAITRTGPNQMQRYLRDNRMAEFVEKDPSEFKMQEITPTVVKAYHKLFDLVDKAAEYSGNKVDTPESKAEVKGIHDEIVQLCADAKMAIEKKREEERNQ